ncbi:MAG: signal recognition particle-docking protein FtsY [Armatimonadetes bacterium]|nr:signal recognition particle-docking protein FtsY [Armatimonadota bacterium]
MLRGLLRRVGQLLTGKRPVDDDLLDELEEALIAADVSYDLALELVDWLRDQAAEERCHDAEEIKQLLQRRLRQMLEPLAVPLTIGDERPAVLVMLGVNGVGKTTTIAKLAHRFRRQGLKPMMVAADTFRAAAAEQLEQWAARVGCEVIRQQAGADPGAVVFDALAAAKARGTDVVIIDTAGRLHTKKNLMDELAKVVRIAERQLGRSPDERLLVLDATTGQNALNQARQFDEAVGVTGLILAKLDGTAKGGIVLTIAHQLGLPIRAIGVGEGMEDLEDFSAKEFVEGLFE